MGSEHESDPLVSPRGDEPGGEPGAGADAPFDQEHESSPPVESEANDREPVGERVREREPVPDGGPASRDEAAREPASLAQPRGRPASQNMLPARRRRGIFERTFVRLIATGGVVGIGVVIAAIMASSNSQGWLIGLVVSVVSVVLAALLWSSRVL